MSDTTTASPPVFRPGTSDAEIEAAAIAARRNRRRMVIFWRFAILAVWLGLWEIGGRLGWIDPFNFGTPATILDKLRSWVLEGTDLGPLWYQIWITIEEATIGFFFGAIAGILAGVALGRNAFLADILSIYIKIFNAIPRVVLAPIFIIMFGISGLTSKVALAFVMVFFLVFQNAFQGVREADRSMIDNARILGASPWQLTRSAIIPSAMSWIFASLHVSYSFALTGAIVGEFVGAKYGIGQLIAYEKANFDAPGQFAAIIIILIVALAADYIVTLIEKRLARWRPAPQSEQH